MPKTDPPSLKLRRDDEQYWKKCLTPEQYEVLRRAGTEAAFTGKYCKNKETGIYMCAACGQELFSSTTKFESVTGWPSFTNPVNRENVELKTDTSQGMTRTEVLCKRCGSHLGHVFDDLPAEVSTKAGGPNSKRYCINSISLDFKKK